MDEMKNTNEMKNKNLMHDAAACAGQTLAGLAVLTAGIAAQLPFYF